MSFEYTPYQYKPPEMPKLTGYSSSVPKVDIKNTYTKNILDQLGRYIKPPVAYSEKGSISDLSKPTEELGNEFIQRALLPEFQQNVYNPFRRNLANQTAGSNLSLLGSGQRVLDTRDRAITQPFIDQVQGVQDQFKQIGAKTANDFLTSYYSPQINF